MNQAETMEAFAFLAATSPKWIGSRLDKERNVLLRHCMRCKVTVERALPFTLDQWSHGVSVPPGTDEALFAWMKDFADQHRGCVDPEAKPPDAVTDVSDGVLIDRWLHCAVHGPRKWQGDITCNQCTRVFQTADPANARFAPPVCPCGATLMPPADKQVGDALGFTQGGWMINADGEQTPLGGALADYAARPICYVCFRKCVKAGGYANRMR